jgi:tryptophan synthase alpha chain
VLECLAKFRAESALPVVVMTYANPLVRRGWKAACRALAEAGADGLLVADLPVEEGSEMAAEAEATGLCPIFFVAPTTGEERMRSAISASRGFVYAIGRFGVTGAGAELDGAAEDFLRRVRAAAGDLPVAVGLACDRAGRRRRDGAADVAVVGSALVQRARRSVRARGTPARGRRGGGRTFATDSAEDSNDESGPETTAPRPRPRPPRAARRARGLLATVPGDDPGRAAASRLLRRHALPADLRGGR